LNKIFVIILFFTTFCIHAENIFRYKFNIGNAGIGFNYSLSKDDNVESFVELFDLGIRHNKTKIGIEFSPIKYWFWSFGDEVEPASKFSFINFDITWNILNNRNFFFGPFSMINYMIINNFSMIKWNEYIATCGLRFSLIPYMEGINTNYQIFCGEIGYRNISGQNKFYFSINVDIILLSLIVFTTEKISNGEKK
jgi:hypothetical protein